MNPSDWLASVQEPIIEPERPICDPHHHLWDFPDSRYLLDELLEDTGSGHNIVSTVYVECTSMYRDSGPVPMRPVGETEFVNGVAAMTASGRYGPIRVGAGVVSLADLNLGSAVGDVLDAHVSASSRFRGIRHASGWDANDDVDDSHTKPFEKMLADPTFREGFAELGKRGLSFDAWLYHPQIPELTDLARAFPETTIILDHFGGLLGIGPYEGKREEIFDAWRPQVSQLAECPNVVAKLGGLVMPVNGFGFHKRDRPATSDELVEATARYHRHTIECFGVERCMFESNFPVDRLSIGYHVLWNGFKKLVEDFSEEDKHAMFYGTAERVYSLQD